MATLELQHLILENHFLDYELKRHVSHRLMEKHIRKIDHSREYIR